MIQELTNPRGIINLRRPNLKTYHNFVWT